MDEGLIKARRNLLATSVILILFDFAKVSIGQVSVLGTNLIIGDPSIVHAFIWALWGYLLLRYLQHLAAEDDLGIVSSFSGHMHSRTFFELGKIVKRHNQERHYSNVSCRALVRLGFLKWRLPLVYYNNQSQTNELEGYVEVPSTLVLGAWLSAVMHVVLMRPRVTEYILPLVVAAAVPIVAVLSR